MNQIQRRIAGATLAAVCLGVGSAANAGRIIGGDAADIASADAVVDIVFAIDVSGSMSDDQAAISSAAQTAIANLNCPDIDVYVRASFYGINSNWGGGSIFDQSHSSYLLSQDPAAVITATSVEDNGPVVNDLVNHFPFFGDGYGDVTGKTQFKAIVTIGDEGTENGQPVTQADWDAAVSANQAAINSNTFLFSWVADPFTGVPALFTAMAEGGTAPAPFTGTCGDTGGSYLDVSNPDPVIAGQAINDIICTTGGGGTGGGQTPIPGTLALLGLGLLGVGIRKRLS